MNMQIEPERRYIRMKHRQGVLILIMGMFFVFLGLPYLGLLTGGASGIDPQRVFQPSVLVKASGAWFLVDGHGIVRGAVSHDRIPMLPQLYGIDSDALLRQDIFAVDAAKNGAVLATLLLDGNDQQLHEGDLKLDFSNPKNIVAALGGTAIHFGNNQFREKWDRVMHVRGDGSVTLSEDLEWDLRFPNTLIVRELQ